MKKLLSLAVVAQIALFVPAQSQADTRGRDILSFGLGVITGLVVGNLSSRDSEEYHGSYNSCMNDFRCGDQHRRRLPDQNQFIEIRPGQRMQVDGFPRARCRSFDEVIVNHRGAEINTNRKYACVNSQGQWVEAPRKYHNRFRPYEDYRSREWRAGNDRPAILQRQHAPIQMDQRPRPQFEAPPFGAPAVIQQRPDFDYGHRPPPSGPIYRQQPTTRPQAQDCRATRSCGVPPAILPPYNPSTGVR